MALWMLFSSMSQIAATWTSFMAAHSPTWARPRPFTPTTAIRSTSFGPTRREFARRGAGSEAAAAAIIEPCRNSRRLKLVMSPPLDVFRDHIGLPVLAREELVGLLVRGLFALGVDRDDAADVELRLVDVDPVLLQVDLQAVARLVG